MSKHTPGPWKVVEFTDFSTDEKAFGITTEKIDIPWGYCPHIVTEPGKEPDCSWGTVSADEYEANAKLIAAAPEMLSALQEAQEIIQRATGAVSWAVEQAIKKAKGE